MGWTKHFVDGTLITEPASWSKTRLDRIHSVKLNHRYKEITIVNPNGEFWQSDTYIADLQSGASQPQMIERRIESKITNINHVIYIRDTLDHHLYISFDTYIFSDTPEILDVQEHRGKWFIAEIDLNTLKYKWYISPHQI